MLPTGKTSPFRAAKVVLVTLVAVAVVVGPAVVLTGDVRVTTYGVDDSDVFTGVERPDRAISGQVPVTFRISQGSGVVEVTTATPSGRTIDSASVSPTDETVRLHCSVRGLCVVRAVADGRIASEIVVDLELEYLPDYERLLPAAVPLAPSGDGTAVPASRDTLAADVS
ncbi:hypothetical protein [Halobaculum sp. MBLA0143]|uniref:hypothetical protein n=1 Tax=Halobaculum sp. MBLA0143 TaxID=3079933 RepID=UPI0035257CE1